MPHEWIRQGLTIAAVFLFGSVHAAQAQFILPATSHTATPTALYADPPPVGTAKPGDMAKLYDKCLTCDRPIKYGGVCCKKHQGCFQKETIFDWSIGCDPKKKDGVNDEGDDKDEPEEDERLASDRPDFTNGPTTVGRGRIQLEGGYTYNGDRSRGMRISTHSYPEALLRIGMFADWFELRLGQNVSSESVTTNGVRRRTTGANDLYLGAKLALTKQKGILPETALIIQGTVPSGAKSFSANSVTYGFDYLFSWELNDTFSLTGNFQGNKAADDTGRDYVLFTQSFSLGYDLAKNLTGYTEWFAMYPTFANETGGGAQHYLDGGLQYFVTKNFALDIRAGIGLSRSADDFFVGTGFAVRY